jgi:hypothetical protein
MLQIGGWVVRVLDSAGVGRLAGMAEAIAAVAALAAWFAGEHGAGRDVPLGDW